MCVCVCVLCVCVYTYTCIYIGTQRDQDSRLCNLSPLDPFYCDCPPRWPSATR